MEFKKYKLSELSKENKGTYGIGASAVDYSEDLYTYLRITDIKEDGSLDYSNLKSIDDSNAEKYILKKGDIVFARTGNSTGKAYYYDGEIPNLVYAGFLIKFSLDEKKVNPKFIKYYTMTKEYKNWVKEIQTGSTRGNINEKMYGNMKVRLPSRIYQDKMVALLEGIDRKVELNVQINNNLLEISQNLYENYINTNKNIIYKKIRELNPILESGKRPNGGVSNIKEGIPSVGAENVKELGYYDYSKTKYVTEEFFNKMKKGILKGYEVLIYKDGGKPGYFIPNFSIFGENFPFTKCAINEHVFLLDFNDIKYNCFAYYYFNSFKIRHQLHVLGSKSAAIPGINQQDVLDLEIPYSESEEFKNLSNILKLNTQKILKNSYQNRTLEQLRDILLPKLMNGEIDLDKIEF